MSADIDPLKLLRDRLAYGDTPACKIIDNQGDERVFTARKLIQLVDTHFQAIEAAQSLAEADAARGIQSYVYVESVETRPASIGFSLSLRSEPRVKGGAS